MKFSIIVPVYNAEIGLPRCIASILGQTFPDFELILVDDGSSDASPEICDRFARQDSRISVIHKTNGGVSSARNAGLAQCSGDRILFIDSDDYIESNCLYDFSSHDEDLVISGYQIEGHGIPEKIDRNFNPVSVQNPSPDCLRDFFTSGMFNYVWTKSFSGEIIRKYNIRYNQQLNYAEDTLFVVDYVAHCKSVAQIAGVPYHYVKYPHETLTSGNLLSEKMINKIETSNGFIHSSLIKIIGIEDATNATAMRISQLYKEILGQLLAHPETKKDFITFLFHQKWFRESLNYVDEFYADEDKKFRTLLKTKLGLLFWLYLKLKKFTL